jgi:hypothetical protein
METPGTPVPSGALTVPLIDRLPAGAGGVDAGVPLQGIPDPWKLTNWFDWMGLRFATVEGVNVHPLSEGNTEYVRFDVTENV